MKSLTSANGFAAWTLGVAEGQSAHFLAHVQGIVVFSGRMTPRLAVGLPFTAAIY
jgi:hypothetical protein